MMVRFNLRYLLSFFLLALISAPALHAQIVRPASPVNPQIAPRPAAPQREQADARPLSPLKQQIRDFERSTDACLRKMFGDQPFAVLQEPKASYLAGYGLVLHVEVNLYPIRALTPFGRPFYTEDELNTEHQQKIARMKLLRATIEGLMVQQAAKVAKAPEIQNLGLIVHLFNTRPYPEIPDQIVFSGAIPALSVLQTGKAQPAEVQKAISVREF